MTLTAEVNDSVRFATDTETIEAPVEDVPRAKVRSAKTTVPIVTATLLTDTCT